MQSNDFDISDNHKNAKTPPSSIILLHISNIAIKQFSALPKPH